MTHTYKVKRINWMIIDLAKLILFFTIQSDIISILFFGGVVKKEECKVLTATTSFCYHIMLLTFVYTIYRKILVYMRNNK